MKTSLAYSSNKISVAMYPICLEYNDETGKLCKGAVTFISDDKDHSHQQVQKFEERMFEIVRQKLQRPINSWSRFSNGCGPSNAVTTKYFERYLHPHLLQRDPAPIYNVDEKGIILPATTKGGAWEGGVLSRSHPTP